jgi:hypothetical protein
MMSYSVYKNAVLNTDQRLSLYDQQCINVACAIQLCTQLHQYDAVATHLSKLIVQL